MRDNSWDVPGVRVGQVWAGLGVGMWSSLCLPGPICAYPMPTGGGNLGIFWEAFGRHRFKNSQNYASVWMLPVPSGRGRVCFFSVHELGF